MPSLAWLCVVLQIFESSRLIPLHAQGNRKSACTAPFQEIRTGQQSERIIGRVAKRLNGRSPELAHVLCAPPLPVREILSISYSITAAFVPLCRPPRCFRQSLADRCSIQLAPEPHHCAGAASFARWLAYVHFVCGMHARELRDWRPPAPVARPAQRARQRGSGLLRAGPDSPEAVGSTGAGSLGNRPWLFGDGKLASSCRRLGAALPAGPPGWPLGNRACAARDGSRYFQRPVARRVRPRSVQPVAPPRLRAALAAARSRQGSVRVRSGSSAGSHPWVLSDNLQFRSSRNWRLFVYTAGSTNGFCIPPLLIYWNSG